VTVTEARKRYADAGLICIPARGDSRAPLHKWRSVRTQEDADRLWEAAPDAPRCGILTGPSRLLVVDLDRKNGKDGAAALEEWLKQRGKAGAVDAHPAVVKTPSGGLHLYYRLPPGVDEIARSTRSDVLPGVDLRGKGGFLVAPPSLWEDGAYEWVGEPDLARVPCVPGWLNELLDQAKAPKKAAAITRKPSAQAPNLGNAADEHVRRFIERASEGNRNQTGFALACQLRDLGLSPGAVERGLLDYQARVPQGGSAYTEDEALQTARSAYHQGARDPAVPRDPAQEWVSNGPPPLTDADCPYDQEPDSAPSQTHLSVVPDNPSARARPDIYAGQADLGVTVDRAWLALTQANQPPKLFNHGDAIISIGTGPAGGTIMRHQGPDSMREHIARAARWFMTRPAAKGQPPERVDARAPADIARVMVANGHGRLPALNRLVYSPVVAPSGRIVTEAGYDDETKTYRADSDLKMDPVPSSPSRSQIEAARDLVLRDLLVDFPFIESDEGFYSSPDRANALALFLLPFARELIPGPTPLHLIEKSTPGSGASLIFQALGRVAIGRDPAIITEAGSEEEWRKRITSTLMDSPAIVAVDNLRRKLDSSALAAALTASVWQDRKLGSSENVSMAVRSTWIATGNNPGVSNEIARRCVSIRIDPHLERPWERDPQKFKHPQLLAWVSANRGRLIHAALTMIQAWLKAGRPRPGVSLGSYEDWSDVIGGILKVAGVEGFIGNRAAFYERADRESSDWGELIAIWWETHGKKHVKTLDVFQIIIDNDLPFRLGRGSDHAQRVMVGKMLTGCDERRFTVEGMTLQLLRDKKRRGSWEYRLEQIGEDDEGEPRTPDVDPDDLFD